MKIDKFVISMLLAVTLSFIAPWLGAKGSPLYLDLVTKWGVALVFFLHGANLSLGAIRAGAANWRLHLFIQTTTFVIFPIIGIAFFIFTSDFLSPSIRIGFYFLCALSSTISSSVTMTSIGNGNIAGAVFDATISGIIGIFLTPFLISMILRDGGKHGLDLFSSIGAITKTLLMPFILGQLARPLLLKQLTKYKRAIGFVDKSVIVLIVFVAFCNANAQKIWDMISAVELFITFGAVLLLLGLVLWLLIYLANHLHFDHQDKVAGVFCGATKSLANGAPIAAILFAGSPDLGIILIPIMIYHQSQLIACSILAKRWSKIIENQ